MSNSEKDPKTVAAIPGGGYRARFTGKGGEWSLPILAWLVDEGGHVSPVTVEYGDPTTRDDFIGIIEPDGEP